MPDTTNDEHEPLSLHGRMLDCDGHLYMEPDVMADIVGAAGASWIIDYLRRFVGSEQDQSLRARARDDVWTVKGISATGSADVDGRLAAMDAMGVHRQLMFPNTVLRELRMPTPEALASCRRYNDYVLAFHAQSGGRARVVCQVNMSDPAWALTELRRVIEAGAPGVLLPCAEPPAGTSPANPVWDPFWRTFEESGTPALLHIGAGGLASGDADDPMFPPRAFADAPTLGAVFPERPGGEELVERAGAGLHLSGLVLGALHGQPDIAHLFADARDRLTHTCFRLGGGVAGLARLLACPEGLNLGLEP